MMDFFVERIVVVIDIIVEQIVDFICSDFLCSFYLYCSQNVLWKSRFSRETLKVNQTPNTKHNGGATRGARCHTHYST